MTKRAASSPWTRGAGAPARARSRWFALVAVAAASGLLLFVSDYPVHAWPLQLVALLPVLWGLCRYARSTRAAAAAGAVLGLAYTGPSVVALEFPLLLGGLLAVYISLLWSLLVAGAYQTMRWPAPWGALATGAVATVVEWADCTLLPIWGTAQAFVRVWTAAPWAVQFASLVGVTGVVFVVVSVQALITSAVQFPARRTSAVVALVALLALVAGIDAYRWSTPPVGQVRVAAMGWTQEHLPGGSRSVTRVLGELYRPLFRRAVDQGAQLVVSPEVGFWARGHERELLLGELGALAREHRVWLAAGYFDVTRNDNRIAFVDPHGVLRGEYVKTHLIAGVENYRAGSGRLIALDLPPTKLGGMICQDDNFTDLSRALGRHGVGLVAVPTNDWQQVKDHHLENSLFRPIESGYGVVRATSNGISVIASPRGEILARQDHFLSGPGVLVANVPVAAGSTLYSHLGEWWPLGCAVGLLVGSIVAPRRRRRTDR